MRRICFVFIAQMVFLFCGSAEAAEGQSARHPFSIIIREEFGNIAVGDLNTTLFSMDQNQRYKHLRENHPERLIGEIREVPNGYTDVGVELQWEAWLGFMVGISVSGSRSFYSKSSVTYTIARGQRQTDDNTYESGIQVSPPVKLTLYRSFPVFPRARVILGGGVGFYSARMTQTHISYTHFPSDGEQLWNISWDVNGRSPGFHCGLSLEYKLNNRFSILAESQWAFAKINSLDGSVQYTNENFDPYGIPELAFAGSEEGPLYHYYGEDLLLGGVEIEKLLVTSLEPPWSGIDFPRDVRKAYMDLGGHAFKVGLLIRLF